MSACASHLREADDLTERMILARRLVAERCLYGVDKNPLAVEMAKLSLWLMTMAKGRPFSFLDHALKCGDSLVGVDEEQFLRWSQTLKGVSGPLYLEENQRSAGRGAGQAPGVAVLRGQRRARRRRKGAAVGQRPRPRWRACGAAATCWWAWTWSRG